MAEIVGLAASIIQIAGAGAKLSTTLYNFVNSAARADREISDIAEDVGFTANALESVGEVFANEDVHNVVSKKAILDAKKFIKRCEAVFEEIRELIEKRRKVCKDGKKSLSALGKFTWPMKEPRIQLLRGRLESLKNDLILLFHVLQLANSQAKGKLEKSALEEEREKIRELHQRQQDSLKALQSLESKLSKVSLDDDDTLQGSRTPSRIPTIELMTNAIPSKSQDGDGKPNATHPAFAGLDSATTDDSEMSDSEGTVTDDEGEHLTVDELARCAKHVQKLLKRISTLQQTLHSQQQASRYPRNRVQKLYRRFCRKFEFDMSPQSQSSVGTSITLPLPPFKPPLKLLEDAPTPNLHPNTTKSLSPERGWAFAAKDSDPGHLIPSSRGQPPPTIISSSTLPQWTTLPPLITPKTSTAGATASSPPPSDTTKEALSETIHHTKAGRIIKTKKMKEVKHVCKICNKVFYRLDLFARHQARHDEPQRGKTSISEATPISPTPPLTGPDSLSHIEISTPAQTPLPAPVSFSASVATTLPPQTSPYYPQDVSPLPESTTTPSHVKQRSFGPRQSSVTIPPNGLQTNITWNDPFSHTPQYSSSSGYASPIHSTGDYANMFTNPPYDPESHRIRTSSAASSTLDRGGYRYDFLGHSGEEHYFPTSYDVPQSSPNPPFLEQRQAPTPGQMLQTGHPQHTETETYPPSLPQSTTELLRHPSMSIQSQPSSYPQPPSSRKRSLPEKHLQLITPLQRPPPDPYGQPPGAVPALQAYQHAPPQAGQSMSFHMHRLPTHPPPNRRLSMEANLVSPHHTGPPCVVGLEDMPPPAPRPRGPKLKFTREDDQLLIDLKETKNLTWKQIADFFPGRSSGTLQVRYCTRLRHETRPASQYLGSKTISQDLETATSAQASSVPSQEEHKPGHHPLPPIVRGPSYMHTNPSTAAETAQRELPTLGPVEAPSEEGQDIEVSEESTAIIEAEPGSPRSTKDSSISDITSHKLNDPQLNPQFRPPSPPQYKCLYPLCKYASKRESNCKQHMEKTHGWEYVRSRNRGKEALTAGGKNSPSAPPIPFTGTPGSALTTPVTPSIGSASVPSMDNFDYSYGFGTPALSVQGLPDDYRRDGVTTDGSVLTYSSGTFPTKPTSFDTPSSPVNINTTTRPHLSPTGQADVTLFSPQISLPQKPSDPTKDDVSKDLGLDFDLFLQDDENQRQLELGREDPSAPPISYDADLPALPDTNVKPFKCFTCHMSFTRREHLERHCLIHRQYQNNQEGLPPSAGIVPKSAGRTPIACSNCAKTKTKCDKKFPCSRCASQNLQCTLRPTRRASKNVSRIVTSGDGSGSGISSENGNNESQNASGDNSPTRDTQSHVPSNLFRGIAADSALIPPDHSRSRNRTRAKSDPFSSAAQGGLALYSTPPVSPLAYEALDPPSKVQLKGRPSRGMDNNVRRPQHVQHLGHEHPLEQQHDPHSHPDVGRPSHSDAISFDNESESPARQAVEVKEKPAATDRNTENLNTLEESNENASGWVSYTPNASHRLIPAQATEQPRGRRMRGRTKALTAEQRKDAALMRKVGACSTCKSRKERCDPSTPCKSCISGFNDGHLPSSRACRGVIIADFLNGRQNQRTPGERSDEVAVPTEKSNDYKPDTEAEKGTTQGNELSQRASSTTSQKLVSSSDDTASLLLASRSNYQNILDGVTLPGVEYPPSLASNLMSKRTSHNVTEQGRRSRIEEGLKESQQLPLAQGPKRGEKMSLDDFINDQSLGSWADEMEDAPAASAAESSRDRSNSRSASPVRRKSRAQSPSYSSRSRSRSRVMVRKSIYSLMLSHSASRPRGRSSSSFNKSLDRQDKPIEVPSEDRGSFTPLVSPTTAPHEGGSTDPKPTVREAYSSPLTSPALEAQNRQDDPIQPSSEHKGLFTSLVSPAPGPRRAYLGSGKRKRSESAAISVELSEEDQLLLRLKDEENMPWKDITARFQSDFGKTYPISTLQMRLKRLRELSFPAPQAPNLPESTPMSPSSPYRTSHSRPGLGINDLVTGTPDKHPMSVSSRAEDGGDSNDLLFITGNKPADFKAKSSMTKVRKKAMGSFGEKEKKPNASNILHSHYRGPFASSYLSAGRKRSRPDDSPPAFATITIPGAHSHDQPEPRYESTQILPTQATVSDQSMRREQNTPPSKRQKTGYLPMSGFISPTHEDEEAAEMEEEERDIVDILLDQWTVPVA